MKSLRLALPFLAVAIACGAPPPAGGSAPPAGNDAAADAQSDGATADAETTDAAADIDKADMRLADTPAPVDAAADVLAPDLADGKVPDGQPLTDAPPPADLAAPDLPPPDTAKPDAPKPADITAPDAAPPPPGEIGIGKCTQAAPGWNSCVIQAFWQCIQPTATCAKKVQSEFEFSASWAGGGELQCKIDIGASTAVCTGFGPDGKKCLDFVETFDLNAKTATAEVTGPNGKHTMTFQGDTINVKCGDGKAEFYASGKELCAPISNEGCPQKDEPPPGPGPDPCPPMPICKDNGACPPNYVCEPNSNLCLQPCPVDAPCPPCTTCDPTTQLCSP